MASLVSWALAVLIGGLVWFWRKEYRDELRTLRKQHEEYREAWLIKIRSCVREGPPCPQDR